MKLFGKKGITVQNLGSYALAFCVAVIIVSVSAQVLGQIRATQTSNSYEYNVTGEGLSGLETMGEWFPTIATIIAAVVIIVLIVSGFRPTMGRA